jgi:hypothetical protein
MERICNMEGLRAEGKDGAHGRVGLGAEAPTHRRDANAPPLPSWQCSATLGLIQGAFS